MYGFNSSFDVVEENTGYLPVEDHINAIQILATDKMVMTEAGFVEIFVNNEAQTPVYYDNMMVVMSSGSVSEVNAYYPFGKRIPLLSTPASLDNLSNKYLYNEKEIQTELDLNWHDFGARMLNGERWFVPDPLAEMVYSWSPYVYCANNPIKFIDIEGKIWKPSPAVEDSYAYSLVMGTTEGQNIQKQFTTGNMKNHIFETYSYPRIRGTGGMSVGFSKNGKFEPIENVTGNDIKNLQLWFKVNISDFSLDDVDGAEIFGHEAFIHQEQLINASQKILSNSNLTNKMKAEALQYIQNLMDFRKNGILSTFQGQFDHAKFIKGEKSTYNQYISQLLKGLSNKERAELMRGIESYFNSLFIEGNEYVIRYTGKEAQDLLRELQKLFQ